MGLSAHGRTPTPDAEADARRALPSARIDREIRSADRAGVILDDARAGHLIGLLLVTCHVPGEVMPGADNLIRASLDALWSPGVSSLRGRGQTETA